MVKIIPELNDLQIQGIKSRAERLFYKACLELNSEWLVLHSIPFVVNLSGEPRDGEADFVIFSPTKGFIVVEIKGGGIEYDPKTNKWTSIDATGVVNPIKDPFQQGMKEKKAILKMIQNNSHWAPLGISHLTCGHAVFFPDLDNLQQLILLESPPEIMGGRGNLQNLEDWINNVFSFWKGDLRGSQALGSEGMKIINEIFCTGRKVMPLLSAQIQGEEEQRIELTEQQKRYLRALGKRKRAAICGGAGTGKTLLAVDRARQLAKAGKKTLLLCYNRPLADHLKDVIGQDNYLLPMDFHEFCKWRVKQTFSKTGRDLEVEAKSAYPGQNYFDVQLPFALGLSVDALPDRYDAIIVDEGQDFKDDYWLPLEMLLQDENESYLYVFLDVNQALYQHNTNLPFKDEPLPLTLNCRNTKYIHEVAYHFYRGDPVDPPTIEGVPVETHAHETMQSQASELHSLISSMISTQNIEPKDIVILVAGPTKETYYNSLRFLTLPKGIKYSIEAHRIKNTVLVDTVGRFKGLETNILILWGLDEFDPIQDKEALYVAFSRAKSRLHIFGSQTACKRALETRF